MSLGIIYQELQVLKLLALMQNEFKGKPVFWLGFCKSQSSRALTYAWLAHCLMMAVWHSESWNCDGPKEQVTLAIYCQASRKKTVMTKASLCCLFVCSDPVFSCNCWSHEGYLVPCCDLHVLVLLCASEVAAAQAKPFKKKKVVDLCQLLDNLCCDVLN